MTTTIIVDTDDGTETITTTSDITDLDVERTIEGHGYDANSVSYDVQTSDIMQRISDLEDRITVLEDDSDDG